MKSTVGDNTRGSEKAVSPCLNFTDFTFAHIENDREGTSYKDISVSLKIMSHLSTINLKGFYALSTHRLTSHSDSDKSAQ